MEKLVADGVKEVVIQPTHIMNGFEYDDVVAEVTPYADQFDFFAVGDPLLTSEEDYEYVINAVMSTIPEAVLPIRRWSSWGTAPSTTPTPPTASSST
jgi:sirohydrochlorin cobaltochelatase